MDQVAFVFQNTQLFQMSILDNICFGKPDATREEVERVVDLAQCREIIDKLPSGLDTMIGTKGVYLSGGEQQRVALARAILKMPQLLCWMKQPHLPILKMNTRFSWLLKN